MKKLLISLLTVACALCLAFAVAGCNPDGGESSGGTNTQQGETGGSGSEETGGSGSEETGGSGSEETGGEQEVNPPVTNKYTVTYDANGGKFAEGGSTITQSVEELSKLTAPLSPARSNYAFLGWAKNKSGSEMWKFEEDTVTGNITLYAQWTQESAVILSVEGASIEDKSIFMLVDKDTDSISLSSKVVCSDDSIWRLYSDPDGQREIPTKMVTRLSNGNNTYYIVVNSQNQAQVNVYELTVHRSYLVTVSYYDDESLLDTKELYTGNTFTASYLPDITGYTFNGWKELSGTAFTSDVIYSPLVLYADKTANTYKATFDVNGGNALSETEKTVTYDSEYSFPVPTRTGYSFTGWYADGTQLTNEEGKSILKWQYAKAQNITAHWSANNYKVTLNVNDTQAGTVYGDGEHAYDSQVIINVYTNKGYNFIGLYDKDNQLVSDQERYTFKMGFAVSYTAKWEVDPAMENFVFTSTPTTCTISDVKDNSVQTIDIPDYVTSIGDEAFWDCKSLTSITIPNNVTSIGGGAFSGCTNLENLTLPFVGNGSDVAYLGYIFGARGNYSVPKSLKTVIITGSKNIGERAFEDCTSLTSITIGNGVTSIGESAFHGCESLESITIPFVGGSRKTADKTDQYPFGYIFGTESFSGASAIEQKYYGNSTSKTTITKYYIPNSLKQVTITGGNILYGAFYNCTNITSVTIGNSVTSIGESAFWDCTSLKGVYVTDIAAWCNIDFDSGSSNPLHYAHNLYLNNQLVTTELTAEMLQGVTKIKKYAFYGCTSLESVTIPDSVTTIGDRAFSGCDNLTSITVTDKNTAYASQDGILYNRSKTKIIFVPEAMKGVVTLPDSVTSIDEDAFEDRTGLTSIIIPNSVTSIGWGAFRGCTGLTSVTIGNGVTSISHYAFRGCTAEIKWGDNPSIKEIGENAFSDYKGTSITIPDSVTSIGKYAFSGCTSLESVTIGDGVTSIDMYAFSGCDNLTSITVMDNNIAYASQDGILYNKDKTKFVLIPEAIKSVTLPDSITSIGDNAFEDCISLESITVTDNNTAYASQDGILYNKDKTKFVLIPEAIKSVTLPDSITDIGNAFAYCANLESITVTDNNIAYASQDGILYNKDKTEFVLIPKAIKGAVTIPDGITSIGSRAFEKRTGLTNITIPDSITSIGDNAFEGCISLESITVTDNNIAYASQDGILYNKDKTKFVLIPKAIKGSITIPDSVTSIGLGAFSGCTSLTNVTIGNSVTSIGSSAFSGCTNLESVTIPDSITSIGNDAFSGCTNLESVTIPDSVISIGKCAFKDCTSLTSVIFNNPNGWYCTWYPDATHGTDISSENLQNPETAATYLKNSGDYLKRKRA